MLEAAIEKACVKYAKSFVKVKKKVFGEQLDRWFLFPKGFLYIVEFKRPGSRLTALQEQELKELIELGYCVEVHDNVEEFKESFNRIKDYALIYRGKGGYLEPSSIPERFRALAVDTRSGRTIRGSGYRQNFHHAGRLKRS